jgi:hypothetical protein
MSALKILARLVVPLALVAAALLVATSAYGAASGGTFSWLDQTSASGVGLVPCYPDLAGTLTGTDAGQGRFVVNSTGVHVAVVETQNYRIDFANGWYLLSSSPTHSTFNTNFVSGQTVSTATQQDRGVVYDASGSVVGHLDVRTVSHLTWRDIDGNGQPDPGEITATVSLFRVTCP